MSKVKLHQLTSGSFVVDKGTLNNRDWGVPYEHPNPMYVMEHPKGIVLFDTGMNHRGLGNPKEWWGETISGLEMRVKEKDCLPAQLAGIGMKPQDVRYVVMSHLHIDHAGEMESFPDATFIVRSTELKFAWWADPHMRHVYIMNDLRNTRKFRYVELPDDVDFDLFGDGSIVCMHTPGHTPGHQSAVVDVEGRDRKVIFCADACYLTENLEYRVYSANLMWNAEAWCRTIGRLRMMKDQGYDLWLGHEMEDWLRHEGQRRA
jgi:glyoxylase-like metal-dependent hydrolase (beta-lactamase superfamily II)